MAAAAPAVRYGAISSSAPPVTTRRKAERLGTVVAFTALLGASASLSFRPLMRAAGARLAVTEAGAAAASSTDAASATDTANTIDVYYVDSKEAMSFFAYDFLGTFVFPLAGRPMRAHYFGSVKQLLESALSDASMLRAGSVVLFGFRGEIETRNRTISNDTRAISNYTIDDSRSVDPYCAYQFSNADPLLATPSVQALLAWRQPLVLVDSNDYSCRVNYPPTIHQVWRNAVRATSWRTPPSSQWARHTRTPTLSRTRQCRRRRPSARAASASRGWAR